MAASYLNYSNSETLIMEYGVPYEQMIPYTGVTLESLANNYVLSDTKGSTGVNAVYTVIETGNNTYNIEIELLRYNFKLKYDGFSVTVLPSSTMQNYSYIAGSSVSSPVIKEKSKVPTNYTNILIFILDNGHNQYFSISIDKNFSKIYISSYQKLNNDTLPTLQSSANNLVETNKNITMGNDRQAQIYKIRNDNSLNNQKNAKPNEMQHNIKFFNCFKTPHNIELYVYTDVFGLNMGEIAAIVHGNIDLPCKYPNYSDSCIVENEEETQTKFSFRPDIQKMLIGKEKNSLFNHVKSINDTEQDNCTFYVNMLTYIALRFFFWGILFGYFDICALSPTNDKKFNKKLLKSEYEIYYQTIAPYTFYSKYFREC